MRVFRCCIVLYATVTRNTKLFMLLHDKSSFLIYFSSKMYCMCVFFGNVCILGWSDFELFLDFQILHITVDQIYFQKFIAKQFFPRACRVCAAKFSHSNNHRGLKKKKFKFATNFILLQRTIAKKKIWNSVQFNIFSGPHNGAMVKGKHIYFCFCF